MIRIQDKKDCCGCTACVSVCPVQCIVMRRDREEGFDYPVANPDICIGCGRCEMVCPVLNPHDPVRPSASFAARNDKYVGTSSSGGVFPVIAGEVIAEGGLVWGATFSDDFMVEHMEAESMDEVMKMRGSKYVQSELFSSFDDIRAALESGRKVLFSGTPCQVAGLRASLGKDYEGLVTVDFACHGVPGPGLWGKYVKELEKHAGGPLKEICFRDKSSGWHHYSFRADDRAVPYMKDPYMALFVQNMTLRPSCYSCPVREGRSGSDLTLADLWNVAAVAEGMNDDRGVSLVCINTETGQKVFDAVRNGIDAVPVDLEQAVKNNGGFTLHTEIPQERDAFFKGLESTEDIIGYMEGFVKRPSMISVVMKTLRLMIYKMKRKLFS